MRKPKYIVLVKSRKGREESYSHFDKEKLLEDIAFYSFFKDEGEEVEAYEIEVGKQIYPEEIEGEQS